MKTVSCKYPKAKIRQKNEELTETLGGLMFDYFKRHNIKKFSCNFIEP